MKIAFWLLPTERDRLVYQALIDQLAETYDAPKFAAHVTIYVDNFDPELDIRSLVQRAIEGISPFCLTIEHIAYTPAFTKTLFVQFQEHAVLTQLCDRLRAQFNPASSFVLNPHLSLIYGSLQEPQQQRLVRELALPGNQVWFDGVSAIAFESSRDRQGIEQMQMLHHHPF